MNSDGQDNKRPDHHTKSRDNRFQGDRFNDDSHKGNGHTGYGRNRDGRDDYGHNSQKGDSVKIGKRFAFIFWVLFLMLMFVFFSDQLAIQENPNQRPQSFVDGRDTVLVLKQNRKGHYVTSGTINNQNVVFLLDTGATDVAIPRQVASRLMLNQGAPVRVSTANGVATAYRTTVDELRIGELVLTNVRATIVPGMPGEQVLLGMSALRQVSFSQMGNELTIKLTNSNY